jgi:hypothetical protein
MPRVKNPFGYPTQQGPGGYNSAQMGAAAQGIGHMLTAGDSPVVAEDRAAKAGMNRAHTDLYGEMARKTRLEADAAATENRAGSDDELFNTALNEHGIDHRLPNQDVKAMLDADPVLRKKVVERFGAYRASRALPGKTTYDNLQKGVTEQHDRSLGDMVLGNKTDAGSVGQAQAAREGKPLVHVRDGVQFSNFLLDKPAQATPVGEARIKLSGAQGRAADASARQHDASAGRERAHTGLYGAQTQQVQDERRTGIKAGAPVIIDTPAGPVYASPREAVGGAAGARPKAAGTNTPKLPFNSAKVFDEEINAQLKDSGLTPTSDQAAAIRARASALFPQVGNITDAVKAARGELGLDVVETPGRFFGTNKKFSNNATTAAPKSPGQMVAPAAPQAAQAVPPPQQRVPGQSYPTPQGPMTWTGTGWLPAR